MVKIKDIAEHMGISISTVYKAFNGAADISEATKEQILETARQMGYTRSARRPAADRQLCVFIEHPEVPHVIYYLYEVMLAFKALATRNGYQVIIRNEAPDSSLTYNEILEQNQCIGCLILGLNAKSSPYQQLTEMKYPTVLVDNFVDRPNISCITSDNLNGLGMVVTHLAQLGHTKIGFINGEPGSVISDERFAGYVSGLAVNHIAFDARLVRSGDFTESSGGTCALELARAGVTALVCASDLMAIGAMRALQAAGYCVPEDISITGFDDIALSTYVSPTLTTIRIKIKDVGHQSFYCLQDLLNNGKSVHLIEPAHLMVRQSTAPAAKRAEK